MNEIVSTSLISSFYGSTRFYAEELADDKQRRKFIQDVVRICRNTLEYKEYTQFLRDSIDLNSCAGLPGIQHHDKVVVELHHSPLTLYDIAEACTARLEQKFPESFAPLSIAHLVLALHYRGWVGLVPLSKTLHELAHDENQFQVTPNMIYGSWDKLERFLFPYLSMEARAKLNYMRTMNIQEVKRRNDELLKVEPLSWNPAVDINQLFQPFDPLLQLEEDNE